MQNQSINSQTSFGSAYVLKACRSLTNVTNKLAKTRPPKYPSCGYDYEKLLSREYGCGNNHILYKIKITASTYIDTILIAKKLKPSNHPQSPIKTILNKTDSTIQLFVNEAPRKIKNKEREANTYFINSIDDLKNFMETKVLPELKVK